MRIWLPDLSQEKLSACGEKIFINMFSCLQCVGRARSFIRRQALCEVLGMQSRWNLRKYTSVLWKPIQPRKAVLFSRYTDTGEIQNILLNGRISSSVVYTYSNLFLKHHTVSTSICVCLTACPQPRDFLSNCMYWKDLWKERNIWYKWPSLTEWNWWG